jgi:hypothetical protein
MTGKIEDKVDLERAYVFCRITGPGTTEFVHSAAGIKDAKYWLTYIAQPGDALCQTPAHPKYNGNGEPTYYAHLVKRGSIAYNEAEWKELLNKGGL